MFGTARAWLFGQLPLDGSQDRPDDSVGILLYPDVAWKGLSRFASPEDASAPKLFRRQLRAATPSTDPHAGSHLMHRFRRDLESSLAQVMVRMGKDLYGSEAIARLAKSADAIRVRETALAQLRDQAALAEIVKSDGDEHLRWAAVSKLTNQAALAEAAQSDPSRNVRLSAVLKLANPAVLSDIAGRDKDPEVRRQAQSRFEKLGKSH